MSSEEDTPRTSIPIYGEIIPNIWSMKKFVRHQTGPIQKTIVTSFAHPINFQYQPLQPPQPPNPPSDYKPCHFCYEFTYGLLGLGKVTVEVIDPRNGQGYMEKSGGHTSKGIEPSRMCTTCARARVDIIKCKKHEILALPRLNEATFNRVQAFNTLFPVRGVNKCIQKNAWCSLCVEPAFYGCACKRSRKKVNDQHAQGSHQSLGGGGCGLLLCTSCAQEMNKNNADLEKTIKVIRQRKETTERADVEFLLASSELYRTYEMTVW